MIATTHETSSRLRLLTRLGFWGSVIGGLLFPWAIMLAVEVVVHQVPVARALAIVYPAPLRSRL
jgi:hypothetical protein